MSWCLRALTSRLSTAAWWSLRSTDSCPASTWAITFGGLSGGRKRIRSGVEHPHFLCVDCGEVTCLTDVQLRFAGAASGSTSAAPGDVTEILLKGHCRRCR